jgi:phenylalanyl-tRNA synthetase beta chain
MKLPYSWLIELTGLRWPVGKVAERLTLCGIACEDIQSTSTGLGKVVVGRVLELHPIQGADKIKRALVSIGKETLQIICGAPNVAVGQKVPVAMVGAKLANGMEIEHARIRGIDSSGMICSESELGISDVHSGIMVLNGNTKEGLSLVEALDYDDHIMTFEITPNRGDAMSAIGIARDLAAVADSKIRFPKIAIKKSKKRAKSLIKVRIEDTEGCPRYAARIIQNVKIAESPWWLKKRLILCGIRPINNVVDITNFIMMECGHPLHAFDYDRFGSQEVIVRRAKKDELFTTLDSKTHKLTPEVLLVTNGKEGVAAGGVMGGLHSEVENSTTNILLEAAYFKSSAIRRSRKQLGMTSESQARFERGADPNGIEFAIDRAAYLFQELCGGEVLNGIVDAYPRRIKPKTATLRPIRCNKVLGTQLGVLRMKKILKSLGFTLSGNLRFKVRIPTFRQDVEREIDLIEEIARIEGHFNIPDATENIGPLYAPEVFTDKFKRDVRQILTGLGFDEIMGHGFADSRIGRLINPNKPQLKIENPVSAELDVMRNSLIPFALSIVVNNLNFRTMDLKMFEIGKVYFQPEDRQEWIEEDRLLLLVTGESLTSWRDKPRPLDFYDLIGALSRLGQHFHWPEPEYRQSSIIPFHEELAFSILLGKLQAGQVGLLRDQLADKLDIKQKVYLAEMPLNPLIELSNTQIEFRPLPIFPAAQRDLAIVVRQSLKAGDVLATIREAAGPLAEKISIFDLYQGKQIETGKKSLAVSIIYRSNERSLSTEEVERRQQLVISLLKDKLNAEIRDK